MEEIIWEYDDETFKKSACMQTISWKHSKHASVHEYVIYVNELNMLTNEAMRSKVPESPGCKMLIKRSVRRPGQHPMDGDAWVTLAGMMK